MTTSRRATVLHGTTVQIIGSIIVASQLGSCQSVTSGPSKPKPAASSRYVPAGHLHVEPMRRLAADPVIIASVIDAPTEKEHDAAEIARIDDAWIASDEDGTPFMRSLLENDVSAYLRTREAEHPDWVESFVVDRQGCLTALSRRTTDFFQGDELKWTRLFVDGWTDYFVDDMEFDISTQVFLHHYSVPIRTPDGALCGVLVIGVAIGEHHAGVSRETP